MPFLQLSHKVSFITLHFNFVYQVCDRKEADTGSDCSHNLHTRQVSTLSVILIARMNDQNWLNDVLQHMVTYFCLFQVVFFAITHDAWVNIWDWHTVSLLFNIYISVKFAHQIIFKNFFAADKTFFQSQLCLRLDVLREL